MSINFALQSILRKSLIEKQQSPVAPPVERMQTRTATQSRDCFRANAVRSWSIPWERGAETTAAELSAIAQSLRAWQLGETSEGRHLRAAAARYAEQSGLACY